MNTIQKILRRPAQNLCNIIGLLWPAPPAEAPPAAIDYDQLTIDGLPLRDALAIRSAEFWLALGEPRLALREFQSLTELARQSPWGQRVHHHAQNAAHHAAE